MSKCVITGRSNKGDTGIILQLIAKLPTEYEMEVHQIKHNMEEDPTKVTIEVLGTELQVRHAHIKE